MSAETLEELLHEGARHYERGAIADAVECWRSILEKAPENNAAQSYLGFVNEYFELEEGADREAIRRAARRARSKRQRAAQEAESPVSSAITSAEEVAQREAELVDASEENSSSASGSRTVHDEQQSDGLQAQTIGLNLTSLHRAGRYEEAVQLAHRILTLVPEHPMATRYIEEYQKQRGSKQAARVLNNLDRVPSLQVPLGEIAYQEIDSRAGFLLSQVDGATSFEDLIQISGLSRPDALRILSSLVERGIIQ